jgi:Protein of unknown function (DUF2561)
MVSRYSAYRREPDTVSPGLVDRIFLGVCAAIWLVLIGVSVAAAVALVDLGCGGFHKMARSPHITWVLYAVIIVSALIIAGAIPVLLRARRMAQAEPITRSMGQARGRQPVRPRSAAIHVAAGSARFERDEFSRSTECSGEVVDRIWLRGTLALTGAIGIALIAVAAASYLMAVRHDSASWICYGLAGLVAAGMPVIEWIHVRQLRQAFVSR